MAGDSLDTFIEDMLKEKQLPGVTDEVIGQLKSDLRQRLLDQIDRALIEALPEDRVDAFIALLDNEQTTDATAREFLQRNGVDIQRVTTQAMLRFRELYTAPPGSRGA